MHKKEGCSPNGFGTGNKKKIAGKNLFFVNSIFWNFFWKDSMSNLLSADSHYPFFSNFLPTTIEYWCFKLLLKWQDKDLWKIFKPPLFCFGFWNPNKDRLPFGKIQVFLRAGSCENGISDSIPILILGIHRFQNFLKGTHVKIESE